MACFIIWGTNRCHAWTLLTSGSSSAQNFQYISYKLEAKHSNWYRACTTKGAWKSKWRPTCTDLWHVSASASSADVIPELYWPLGCPLPRVTDKFRNLYQHWMPLFLQPFPAEWCSNDYVGQKESKIHKLWSLSPPYYNLLLSDFGFTRLTMPVYQELGKNWM